MPRLRELELQELVSENKTPLCREVAEASGGRFEALVGAFRKTNGFGVTDRCREGFLDSAAIERQNGGDEDGREQPCLGQTN
jgi:hypothetical protein